MDVSNREFLTGDAEWMLVIESFRQEVRNGC